MNWYIGVLKKYAVFDGRAQRKEYWFFNLFSVLVVILLVILGMMTGTFDEERGVGIFDSVYGLAVLLPSLAVSIRRLHDTGRSGWWLLVALIPLLGAIALLVFMVMDSEAGDNQFGPNPKGVPALPDESSQTG